MTELRFVGIPFALPYFAVVDQIMKSGLSLSASISTLAVYNAIYALPFAIVPLAVAVSGASAKPLLEKVNDFISRIADLLMPWMFGALGAALVADSAAFYVRGTGLWQF